MPAVAITDQCNLFALVKFYSAALERGMQPIIGVDLHAARARRQAGPAAADAARARTWTATAISRGS